MDCFKKAKPFCHYSCTKLKGSWYLNLDVKKVYVKTKAHTSSGATRVSTTVHLDPYIYGIGIAYRF